MTAFTDAQFAAAFQRLKDASEVARNAVRDTGASDAKQQFRSAVLVEEIRAINAVLQIGEQDTFRPIGEAAAGIVERLRR